MWASEISIAPSAISAWRPPDPRARRDERAQTSAPDAPSPPTESTIASAAPEPVTATSRTGLGLLLNHVGRGRVCTVGGAGVQSSLRCSVYSSAREGWMQCNPVWGMEGCIELGPKQHPLSNHCDQGGNPNSNSNSKDLELSP